MADITVRNKKYKLKNDVEYYYVMQFRKASKEYDTYDNPDIILLKTLMEAICPDLLSSINFDELSIGDERLTFKEVKKLLIDLRTNLENIINAELDSLTEYIEGGAKEAKNS